MVRKKTLRLRPEITVIVGIESLPTKTRVKSSVYYLLQNTFTHPAGSVSSSTPTTDLDVFTIINVES